MGRDQVRRGPDIVLAPRDTIGRVYEGRLQLERRLAAEAEVERLRAADIEHEAQWRACGWPHGGAL